MDLFCVWSDKCRAIDFVHPPTNSTLYLHVTCFLASPSKFHRPKPNRWCTHFVISIVSETGGHEEGRKSQEHDLWYYLLSTAYLFYRIQLMHKIPIDVLHCFSVVPKLFILSVQESEIATALIKLNMCCHLWETIKLVIKERDKRYMGTT
jgi:hypothetical protein